MFNGCHGLVIINYVITKYRKHLPSSNPVISEELPEYVFLKDKTIRLISISVDANF